MKSVLISIQPKWVEKIASGVKTIEVRKRRPKLETPFKCYIYMTKNGSFNDFETDKNKLSIAQFLRNQGKVIGEFVCDRIEEVYQCNSGWVKENGCISQDEFFDYLGIPRGTHFGYDKKAYAWHISDLKIYDKPKELSNFIKPFKYDCDGLRCCTKEELEDIYEWDCETLFKNKYPNFDFDNCKCEDCPKAKDFYRLKLAPQSWCYVGSLGEQA